MQMAYYNGYYKYIYKFKYQITFCLLENLECSIVLLPILSLFYYIVERPTHIVPLYFRDRIVFPAILN